jgi:uncharacterized protein YjbJ (UPF0337 family)
MSITDKVAGRVKKAAGDITGNKDLYRRGARSERKGQAKDEAQRARDRADRKADEVRSLEHATNPRALADDHTREELQSHARKLGIEGRSKMNKDELARAIVRER